MVNCVVCGRSRTRKTMKMKFSLHRFPVNPKVRKTWINFVGRTDWEPTKNSFICSQHFVENCFDRSSMDKIQLKKGAIPTIKIERLKYDRDIITNADHQTSEPEPEPDPSTISETIIVIFPVDPDLESLFMKRSPSPQPGSSGQESPGLVSLKCTIRNLQIKDRIRAKRMRLLQKQCWHQQKRLNQLSNTLQELKKKQFIKEEDHVAEIMDNISSNQD